MTTSRIFTSSAAQTTAEEDPLCGDIAAKLLSETPLRNIIEEDDEDLSRLMDLLGKLSQIEDGKDHLYTILTLPWESPEEGSPNTLMGEIIFNGHVSKLMELIEVFDEETQRSIVSFFMKEALSADKAIHHPGFKTFGKFAKDLLTHEEFVDVMTKKTGNCHTGSCAGFCGTFCNKAAATPPPQRPHHSDPEHSAPQSPGTPSQSLHREVFEPSSHQ